MSWYLDVIKNYVGFSGRARRKEYWMFALINFIIGLLCSLLMNVTELFAILYGLYSLFILLPSIAVTVRRLHDIGKSGWWFLISFIPLVGPIILLVFLCLDSEVQENQYGENPKAV